ncbi:hypothetical protein I601_2166 [Nocardioides dokdonensis FR1436]|uniref:Uncharacterized protein n=1 Tax=Nocardioides dokdonensis FR1436 TaxID=1300347 RepID=A0A1A9GM79_9ACTN|nr:hypothetical protein [Nocardioides dokdonensis]ANH38591.1 hypothetical protein I601_2166 [Nocardioides dokdonensis FR1436]
MPSRRVVALALLPVLASGALVGCGDDQGEDPVAHADVTAAGSAVRLVDRSEADLVLHVSNQSFDDERVGLEIAVDGVTVVDDDFHVGSQHNWVSFSLSLPSGAHEVTAESDSGATLRERFRVLDGTTRYAVIDHWGAGDSAELTWLFQRGPVAFD